MTYVRVGSKWEYVCILVDLFNREIIGYSAGKKKYLKLMEKVFATIRANLENTKIFHTDRGNEFKNSIIGEKLESFSINRSLSMKGDPYDNVVAEVSFKIIET